MKNTPAISDAERDMLQRRQILIEGPIDDACANNTIAKLLFLNMQDPKAPIALVINSPGGQVTAMLPIFDTLEFLDAPVHTYGRAMVGGTALWLLAAGEPGQRCIQPDSWMSIEPTQMNPVTFESLGPVLGYMRQLNERLAMLLVAKTALDEAEAKRALASGRSFSAEEAIAVRIADRVCGAC